MKRNNINSICQNFILPLFLVALLNVPFTICAQKETSTYNIGKRSVIRNFVKRGDAGFVISTSHVSNYNKNYPVNIKIASFDNTLNKKWEVTEEAGDFRGNKFFITNEATEYIYWMGVSINNKKGDFEAAPGRIFNINRYDKDGKAEKFKTEITEASSEVALLHVFSDADNLYYLSVLPFTANTGKKKEGEEVYLYIMGHDEKKFEKRKLDLNLKKYGQMSFIGHTDSNFYLCQKRTDMTSNKLEIDVFCLDMEGELVSTFTIIPKIKNFYLPSDFANYNNWDGDHDNYKSYYSYYKGNVNYYSILPNALINIMLDKKYKRFCVYAITSNSNNQTDRFGGPAENLLLQTYSLSGAKLSSETIEFSKKEINNKHIKKRTSFGGKEGNFTVISENVFKIDFAITGYDDALKTTTYYFSKTDVLDGKLKQIFKIEKIHMMSEKPFLVEYGRDCQMRFQLKYGLNFCEGYVPTSYASYLESVKRLNNKHTGYSTFDMKGKTILFKVHDIKGDTEIEFMLFD